MHPEPAAAPLDLPAMPAAPAMPLAAAHALCSRILAQVGTVILGKEGPLRLALACLLARGHLLIEDVPGVGKTSLAQAFARCLGLRLARIQFTSDLLPADIIGTSIFDRERHAFVFHPGPVFAHLVLADEINRATPKAQSALLEAMEERTVTVDGVSHVLPDPFLVIATQNPHLQIGTFPLPESQLDRFLMRLDLGFPDRAAELRLLQEGDRRVRGGQLPPLLDGPTLAALHASVLCVPVALPLQQYILDLLAASRRLGGQDRGLSPRAGLALQRAAQCWACIAGRAMVLPEDVQAVAVSVIGHRLRPQASTAAAEHSTLALLRSVPIP
jgi:MoxR-like ATPase